MTTSTTGERQPLSIGRIVIYGLIAIVASVAINLIIRALGMALIDVSPDFDPLSDPWPTVSFTSGLVFMGVVVFALVDRFTSNPARIYNIIAFVAFLLSLVPDIMMMVDPEGAMFGGVTTGSVMILMVQHLFAYLITVYTLTVLAYRT